MKVRKIMIKEKLEKFIGIQEKESKEMREDGLLAGDEYDLGYARGIQRTINELKNILKKES